MKLSELLKKYRHLHNLTMQEFADKTNLSKSYISQLENEYSFSKSGEKMIPSIIKLNQIAKGMDINLDDLLKTIDDMEVSLTDDSFSDDDSVTELPPESIIFNDYFPLHYCINLSGGSFDEILEAEPDAVVYVPIVFQSKRKRLHAFQINGTSMNNVFPDHSIVVVEDNSSGIKYKDGTIVVAYHGGEATVKRFYAKEDGIVLMPDSSDKSHLPIVIPNDEQLLIFGHVIWHMNPEDIAKYY